jgi:glycosyltransferase involved in cell wall biosynthesis
VVEDGLTGYVVKDETGAVAAVGRIDQLSRERVRERFEERFTARRMVQEYLDVYRSLMATETPHLRVVSA